MLRFSGAMEVLPTRALADATWSTSQSSSVVRNIRAQESCSTPSFSLRPSALVASVVASSSALVASVSSSLALDYNSFVRGVGKATTFADSAAADSSFVVDFDAAADFMSANPMALVAGLAAVAVPFVAFRALASPQTFGSVSAVEAFNKLSNPETNAQLLDIRAPEDIKAEGAPNLKSLSKKSVQVAYTGDANSFLKKVFANYKDPENTTLYILDR